jgi:hypothetical protein
MLDILSSDLISTADVMGQENAQVGSPVVVLGIEDVDLVKKMRKHNNKCLK